ncbi:type 1 glutamine amidotransferase domain-containing protein [Staphylococcus pragensis]|uniref:Type 1 glutamine amidotransferase domain-containing protein n=1 Tax=Staphylococcus pragensis TaxID=1611836 RepID=A0A4Z1BNW2_9STAP|nr:type 1 glutamine amidotransferase domain-containing protein [Staphylococcus pragensis]RTX90211.1 type 1 glutamine amidotransferase domain-containing protein [Staphylococcus carnosus]TGN22301.1 type 1 glutamine amidotransferase domain-containing protein [Staphylococcus pragensis]GGG98627.1 thiazole biosynthesis protein ThiJ [Staphylococcus pragensis]
MKKIIIVNTSTDYFGEHEKPTGLWLSELVHFYNELKDEDVILDIFNITGGNTPIDPVSLSPLMLDKTTKSYYKDAEFMNKLKYAQPITEANPEDYDAIYFTGGHGVMYDFPENNEIQHAIETIYQKGGIVSSVCHGAAALLNAKAENGNYLIADKHITGFSNIEEVLANRDTLVPFHLQNEIKKRDAKYSFRRLPFTPYVLVDERIVTGQNPQSPAKVAQEVKKLLF